MSCGVGAGYGGGGAGGGGYGPSGRAAQHENIQSLLQTFLQHFSQQDREQGSGLLLKTLLTEKMQEKFISFMV